VTFSYSTRTLLYGVSELISYPCASTSLSHDVVKAYRGCRSKSPRSLDFGIAFMNLNLKIICIFDYVS